MGTKKNLILPLVSLIFILGFLSVAFAVTSPLKNSVINAADRLIELQDPSGSWDWVVTNKNGPTGTVFLNIAGVTAEGLLDAYQLTGDSQYLDAAKKTGDYLIIELTALPNEQHFNAFNMVFLQHLANLSGDSQYSDFANSKMLNLMNDVAYYKDSSRPVCGGDGSGCTPSELVEAEIEIRGAGPTGIAIWDLYHFVEFAQNAGQTSFATDVANEIDNYMGQVGFDDTIDYYELGLSGGIIGLENAGLDNGIYVSALLSEQNLDGSFSGEPSPNEFIQSTSYATMALLKVSEKDALIDAVNYLTSHQDSNGGWLEDGKEYAEVDSEAIQAVFDFGDFDGPTLINTFVGPLYPTTSDLVTIKASFNDESGVDKAEVKWSFFTVEDNLERYSTPGYVEMIESEEGIFSSSAPIPSPITTAGGFGEGYVEYRLRPYDLFGNHKSTGVTENPFYFTYDDTPPETSINNVANGDFITSNTEIVLTREDPDSDGDGPYVPSGVNFTKFSIDGGTLQDYSDSFTLSTELTDGPHTITFFSVDNAGNIEEENIVNINLDNTAPEVAINNPENVGIYNTAQLLVNITATDTNLDEVVYSINGAENKTYSVPVNEIFIEETNTLTAYATDFSGNVNSDSITFTVDTITPTIIDNYTLGGTWINSSQTVKLTPLDTDGSGIASVKTCVGTNCEPNNLLGFPHELTFDVSQNTIVRYQAFDVAGNPSAVGEFNVKIDLVTPVTTDDVPTDWQNTSFDVTLTVVGNDGFSPIAQTSFKIWMVGETEPKNFVTGNTIQINVDGEYNIKYFSQDEAGNVEEEKTASNTAKLDTTAPSVIITSESLTDNTASFLVEAVVDDVTSGVKNVTFTLKDSSGDIIAGLDNVQMVQILGTNNYKYLLRMWELEDGVYTLKVTATDNAGNSFTFPQGFTILPNVAPSKITSTNNQVNFTTGGTVTFNFDVTVRGSNEVVFGMDDIAGLAPSAFNARISTDGITYAIVGRGINFTSAESLTLDDLNNNLNNVQGSFTLYLDFAPEIIPIGNYPINYFIGVA